ncbi:MAG TPA: hypothetical protein VKH82_01695, partial [Candidatus Binatia bacterium]|nr:hypothetical protein [Candidatus Binatia bacterium]
MAAGLQRLRHAAVSSRASHVAMQRTTSLNSSVRRLHFAGGSGTSVHVPTLSQTPTAHAAFPSVAHAVPA